MSVPTDISQAVTAQRGRSSASVTAMAPLPVPISKHQHWRRFQANMGWKGAPVFVLSNARFPGAGYLAVHAKRSTVQNSRVPVM